MYFYPINIWGKCPLTTINRKPAMLIRDVDKSFLPRVRARGESPLRKTAEGLGVVLDRLSESVREARTDESADSDSVDSELEARGRNPTRGFKWPARREEDAPAVSLDLTKDESEAFDMLQEARTLAAGATQPNVPLNDRVAMQERLQTLFNEVDSKRIETLSSMLKGGGALTLMTEETAIEAYSGIDAMIMKFLEEAGRRSETAGFADANALYSGHEAALSASEQLRDFLLSEGPAKAFARFREVNRSNVLGLLQ